MHMPTLSPEMLNRLLRQVAQTHAAEIACYEAYRLMDQCADRAIRGEDVDRLMPSMQQHFTMCPDCRQEYHALLRALTASTV